MAKKQQEPKSAAAPKKKAAPESTMKDPAAASGETQVRCQRMSCQSTNCAPVRESYAGAKKVTWYKCRDCRRSFFVH